MIRSELLARAVMLVGASAGALTITPAVAQTVDQTNADAATKPPAPEATVAADNEGQDSATGDIVVTARRTEESLQRVPAAVSAFNERALDRLQATDTTALQGAVPNLNIVQGRGSSNATNIYIRGVGQPDALQTFDPAVGVYVDDVYLAANPRQPARPARRRADRGAARAAGHALRQEHHRRRPQIRHPPPRPDVPRQCHRCASALTTSSNSRRGASGPVSRHARRRLRRAALDSVTACPGSGARPRVQQQEHRRRARHHRVHARRAMFASTSTADYSHDDAELNVGRPLNNLADLVRQRHWLRLTTRPTEYDWNGRTTPSLPNSTKLTPLRRARQPRRST